MLNKKTKIISSYYSEFSHFSDLFNYQILRGGHIKTASHEHHISRNMMPGHEFILCLRGSGWVKIENTTYRVTKNNLVWLPIKYQHEHYPDNDNPWEIYWIRIKGGNLEALMHFLNIEFSPIFFFDNTDELKTIFETIFIAMDKQYLISESIKDDQITRLITKILKNIPYYPDLIINHKSLRHLIIYIQSHYMEEWNIEKLTAFCNLSKSQLIRLFKDTFNETPIKWIKKYRLSQAKYLLVKTEYQIADIAFQIGYKDPLHFSREFKLFSGLSPSDFRIKEKKILKNY